MYTNCLPFTRSQPASPMIGQNERSKLRRTSGQWQRWREREAAGCGVGGGGSGSGDSGVKTLQPLERPKSPQPLACLFECAFVCQSVRLSVRDCNSVSKRICVFRNNNEMKLDQQPD